MVKKIGKRITKRQIWLGHYLNQDNPKTFLNGTQSVIAAGYKATYDSMSVIASQNFDLLRKQIEVWLDENGLSEGKLKGKLLSLVGAKKTIYQKVKGSVHPDSLPPGYRVVTTTGLLSSNEEGTEFFSDGDSLIEIEVESLGIQTKALDMALKVKGMYAAEVHKVEVELIPMLPAEKLGYEKLAKEIAQGEIQKQLKEGDKEDA